MKKLIAILILLIAMPLSVGSEENYTIGKKDLNGTLGEDGRSTRQAWINTIVGEGPTSNDFETYLYFTDPTAINKLWFPDTSGVLITNSGGESLLGTTLVSPVINGTVSGGAIYTAPTLTSPVINSPTINDGTDAQMYVVNASGVMVAVSINHAGDLSGAMANTGIWNGQIVANSVGNTELDNSDGYVVNSLTISALTEGSVPFLNASGLISEDNPNLSYNDTSDLLNVPSMEATGDVFVQGSSGPYGEFYGEALSTLTLDAGVWANIPGVMNGVFSTGMALNNATGCQTVTYSGIYEAIGSVSYEDPDSNSESYHIAYTVDGVVKEKCEEHTDISVQSAHEGIPFTCLLDLSASEEVCAAIVSIGGDDVNIEHINWYLKR